MRFQKLPIATIESNWPYIERELAPAVAHDRTATIDDVRRKLLSGQCEAATVTDGLDHVLLVSEICALDGVRCCWLSYLVGEVTAAPKRWISMMRAGMAEMEAMARNAGCEQIRIGGRDWSKIFPGFEQFDDVPNRLRKVL